MMGRRTNGIGGADARERGPGVWASTKKSTLLDADILSPLYPEPFLDPARKLAGMTEIVVNVPPERKMTAHLQGKRLWSKSY